MRKSVGLIVAPLWAIAFLPAIAQDAPQQGENGCPGEKSSAGLSGEKIEPGSEPPEKKPAEMSAILPSASQNDQSAAPTVQHNGKSVVAEASCDRPASAPR